VGVLSVLVQGLAVGRLARRFAEMILVLAGVLIMAGMLLAWGFTGSVPILLVVLAPLSLAAGVLNTVLPSALTKAVAPDEIGGTLGLNTGMQSLSNVVAPALGGLLLGKLGAWSLGAFGALVMAAMGLFVWLRIAGPNAPSPQGCAPARQGG
jgi:predicted MFS family arabinose efflux permease